MNYKCPTCGKDLILVTRGERSPLSREQFEAVKAGDYYCDKCPSNDRGSHPFRYFWQSELLDKDELERRSLAMMGVAPIIGGPCNGKVASVPPSLAAKPGQLHALLIDGDAYAFCRIDGKLAWHHAGPVTFTPEELERRKQPKKLDA